MKTSKSHRGARVGVIVPKLALIRCDVAAARSAPRRETRGQVARFDRESDVAGNVERPTGTAARGSLRTDEDGVKTPGLGLPRIEASENAGKLETATETRPKLPVTRGRRESAKAGRVQVDGVAAGETASFFSPRAEQKSAAKRPRTIPPRGVNWNVVALALCAFFIFAVLASCIAATDRAGDSFRPREIK